MKRNIIISLFGGVVLLSACHDLDLNPLANGSTENWYSSEKEIEMAVNDYIVIVFGLWMTKVLLLQIGLVSACIERI